MAKTTWTHLSTCICVLLVWAYFCGFGPLTSNEGKSECCSSVISNLSLLFPVSTLQCLHGQSQVFKEIGFPNLDPIQHLWPYRPTTVANLTDARVGANPCSPVPKPCRKLWLHTWYHAKHIEAKATCPRWKVEQLMTYVEDLEVKKHSFCRVELVL